MNNDLKKMYEKKFGNLPTKRYILVSIARYLISIQNSLYLNRYHMRTFSQLHHFWWLAAEKKHQKRRSCDVIKDFHT